MKANSKTFFLYTLFLGIILIFPSCENNKTADPSNPGYPKGLAWPVQFVPTKTTALTMTMWAGSYRISNNMLHFATLVDEGDIIAVLTVMANGRTEEYDLIEVTGKTIKVECTKKAGTNSVAVLGNTYILCTDYSVTGSGKNPP